MLLAALVLVSVQSEHDRLEEDVDLGHRDQSAERSDVPRLGLEEEEQVSVCLDGSEEVKDQLPRSRELTRGCPPAERVRRSKPN